RQVSGTWFLSSGPMGAARTAPAWLPSTRRNVKRASLAGRVGLFFSATQRIPNAQAGRKRLEARGGFADAPRPDVAANGPAVQQPFNPRDLRAAAEDFGQSVGRGPQFSGSLLQGEGAAIPLGQWMVWEHHREEPVAPHDWDTRPRRLR